jgi:hypothetical protein
MVAADEGKAASEPMPDHNSKDLPKFDEPPACALRRPEEREHHD